MLSDELLRKVRLIEVTTRKVVDNVLSGQYRSHFKGQGVQFSEHRLYVPGDDVRHINWKVSARTREPLVKKFEEERELTVFLVVDVSGSESFGTTQKLKSELAAEVGGMLAYAASHTGDRVGVLVFAGKTEVIIPPKKGRPHVLRIISELLTYRAKTAGTDLAGALKAADRMMKHSGVIFVLSDFIAEEYEVPLKKLARKHDVVAISIADQREKQMPEIGSMVFFDPETQKECWVDTSSYAFKKWFKEYQIQRETQTQAIFKRVKMETLKISTQEDYGEAIVRFFRARARRKR